MPLCRWIFRSTNPRPIAYQIPSPLAASVWPNVSKPFLYFASRGIRWHSRNRDEQTHENMFYRRVGRCAVEWLWLTIRGRIGHMTDRTKSENAIKLHIMLRVTLNNPSLSTPTLNIDKVLTWILFLLRISYDLIKRPIIRAEWYSRPSMSEPCVTPRIRRDQELLMEAQLNSFRGPIHPSKFRIIPDPR